ncbi:MAG: lytic transglycosylase domain-containing protein [Oligoflexia bacterium]
MRHEWRLCPLGKHWVKAHPRTGTKGIRGHCRSNPSGKDQIYLDEIREIAHRNFSHLVGRPSSNRLGFPQGNKFDELIRGWTQFWNEVLRPDVPLDPDLVKALIASESGFRATVKAKAGKRAGWARGLMQITDWTQRILTDEGGELKDHLVNVNQADLSDPVANIAAGIRWLFRKKETATSRLGRAATWDEAVAEYKSYLGDVMAGKQPAGMRIFRSYHVRLKGQE